MEHGRLGRFRRSVAMGALALVGTLAPLVATAQSASAAGGCATDCINVVVAKTTTLTWKVSFTTTVPAITKVLDSTGQVVGSNSQYTKDRTITLGLIPWAGRQPRKDTVTLVATDTAGVTWSETFDIFTRGLSFSVTGQKVQIINDSDPYGSGELSFHEMIDPLGSIPLKNVPLHETPNLLTFCNPFADKSLNGGTSVNFTCDNTASPNFLDGFGSAPKIVLLATMSDADSVFDCTKFPGVGIGGKVADGCETVVASTNIPIPDGDSTTNFTIVGKGKPATDLEFVVTGVVTFTMSPCPVALHC